MDKTLLPLSLYIHWPFCKSKCPYCDFNSHVREEIDESAWERAYLQELDRAYERIGDRSLQSIFFGGGTPSLMPPKLAESLIQKAYDLWPNSPQDLEITLEANPNSVEVGRFKAFAQAGINRVSIGVQALNDIDLKKLGRQHSSDEAKQAVLTAQSVFSRVSFDLIYARPDQTLDQWQKELKEALAFGTEHLSLYQLTIEPGTAFAPLHARGELKIPGEDLAADLYEITQEETRQAGCPAYEISNHAKPGAESRHNLVYWQYGDYVGVGPGAHGRLTIQGKKQATRQYKVPETWLSHVLKARGGEEETLTLSAYEQSIESIMMGLRLLRPLELSRLPLPVEDVLDMASVHHLHQAGLLEYTGETLATTKTGLVVLNSLLKKIIR